MVFGLSGYVSQPCRNKLGVRNYERIAMVVHMLQNLYTDPKWVAQEYLHCCKAKTWKTQSADDSLKCFNLKRIIEAETFGGPKPSEVTMEESTVHYPVSPTSSRSRCYFHVFGVFRFKKS